MANRPLFDLLPRNMEFYNFTSVQLTDRQTRVIGMGLKFRPTLKPPPEAQFAEQIKEFCRSVRLYYKFAGQPQVGTFNRRLYVRSDWNPPRENPDLEDKLHDLSKELKLNISNNKPHWKNNLSRQERTELGELKSNESVRVVATDKNLGPALMTTEWIKTETLKHLL